MVDLDRLEALERKATAGPWMPDGVRGLDLGHDLGIIPIWGSPPGADRDLILEARNALPALLRELREARKIVEAARAVDEVYAGSFQGEALLMNYIGQPVVNGARFDALRAALSRETTGGGA
jgi:hypothetical protein